MSSTTANQETITIQPATISDLPTLSKIQVAAYKSDLVSHIMTLDRPDDWSYEALLERMSAPSFQDPDVTVVKAVNISTNRTVGWSCWAVKDDAVPESNASVETSNDVLQSEHSNGEKMSVPSTTQDSAGEAAVRSGAIVTEATAPFTPASTPKPHLPRQILSSLIAADADAQYAKHMTSSSSQHLSSGGRHLVLEGLFVHPEFQRRGIGRALLERFLLAAENGGHGDVKNEEGRPPRDEESLKCWVHASPASWRLYEKMGFKEVERLDVDLGKVMRREEEDRDGGGSGWGVYVFRCMVREGRRKGA